MTFAPCGHTSRVKPTVDTCTMSYFTVSFKPSAMETPTHIYGNNAHSS